MKKWLRRRPPLGERGDVPGWVLITLMKVSGARFYYLKGWGMRLELALMTAALVVLIWGVASDRLVEIFNRAMDSVAGI